MKKLIPSLILIFTFHAAFPCLIVVVTDGQRVLVGNHEDWFARDARARFEPATDTTYGMVVFDFESEGYAQGGMNTEGLFFDGTATPFVPLDLSGKKDCNCYIWTEVLQHCSNVEEAIEFIRPYRLPDLEQVHLLFADRTGQSVIVGAYDGELTFTYRKRAYQILTNFNVTDPEYGGEEACPRYGKALEILQVDSSATVEHVRNILSLTHQEELSVYSNIYDLTAGEVYIYSLADFNRSVKFNLAEELSKGTHSYSVPGLFP
ncbi:MAG: linear amide C-N hydrolase [Phaeodactylibacter sp.]|nr:linear amide C-N hydrolase [Phaeodactylibacter sp.]MCB9048737.1 linear amide C-N hydrolase [Lewinellaceae bacterium]